MGTSSQFHDGAQLKFYPHLGQRYYTSFTTLTCNSTNFLRLTFSQYGKAFSLSATPVAY